MEKWARELASSSSLHITSDLLTTNFVHPGLTYSMFDRDENPSVTSLMFLCFTARSIAIWGRNEKGQTILDWNWTQDDRLEFVVSSELHMSEALYSKINLLLRPLNCTFSVVHIGTTSMVTKTTFTTDGNTKPLLTHLQRTVSVDARTRKPKAYPDRIIKTLKIGKREDLNLKLVETLQPPKNTYVHDVTVSWSDTDGYNHCNFTSYSRFVVDAIHAALRTQGDQPTLPNPSPPFATHNLLEICTETQRHQSETSQANNAHQLSKPSGETSNTSTKDAAQLYSNKPEVVEDGIEPPVKFCKMDSHDSSVIPAADSRYLPKTVNMNTYYHCYDTTSDVDSPLHLCSCKSGNDRFTIKGVTNEVIKCGMKSFKIRYFKECVEGQRLNIHIWQDEFKDNMRIFSSIQRGDDTICQTTTEYFSTVSKL